MGNGFEFAVRREFGNILVCTVNVDGKEYDVVVDLHRRTLKTDAPNAAAIAAWYFSDEE